MTAALGPHSTTGWVLWVVGALVVLAVIAGVLGRLFVKRGLKKPVVVRFINRMSERVVAVVKKPITIAVLDEVADVLQAGNYTRNIAAALQENHTQIREMITEKIKQDPHAKHIGLLPFHDRIIGEVSETTLRVLLEVLADPRTDELVSDMLRDNIAQIRQALRDREEPL
jgi:hypothetical protein